MLFGFVGLTATASSDSFRCRWLTLTLVGVGAAWAAVWAVASVATVATAVSAARRRGGRRKPAMSDAPCVPGRSPTEANPTPGSSAPGEAEPVTVNTSVSGPQRQARPLPVPGEQRGRHREQADAERDHQPDLDPHRDVPAEPGDPGGERPAGLRGHVEVLEDGRPHRVDG